MAKEKLDWLRLRDEYVTASQPVTLTDLAAKYGVARATVSRHCNREQWGMKRDRYLTRVEEQTTEKKATIVANEAAQWDIDCMATAQRLRALVEEELMGQAIFDKKGQPIMVNHKPLLRKKAAKDIAIASKIAQEVGKAALGDKPPPNSDGVTIIIDGAIVPGKSDGP